MAYQINSDCISCGACAPVCPVDCISQGADIYVIDEPTCIECNACKEICPVDAPNPVDSSQ
ncbi:MAG: 4Fe-4S binding protein [Oscillospiraceae bacterium]|nr:4Fe-4S binding protein [Oscillospiraceae bacterium]